MVRSIEKWDMRSMLRPLDNMIHQEAPNLGISPPAEIGPGSGNPGSRNQGPGAPACHHNRRETFAFSFNVR
eukprot:3506737-Pyramimonas_sp.AAC.1